MNLNKHDAQTEMDMNMTPMIDVVFLLIIFFMVITDLTQQELEDLELPVAVTCVPDKPKADEWRPIVNILPSGQMMVKRSSVYDPERDDGFKALEVWLTLVADRMKKKFDAGLGKDLPDEPVLVRADENTPFKYVQKLMEICGKEGIQIWQLQLAAKEDKSDDDVSP